MNELGKTTRILVRIAGALVEIRTEALLSTGQERTQNREKVT
jgi:hypothetical protein